MRRPRIGVAFAQIDYLESLREAGADVQKLSPDIVPLSVALNGLDGLLLTGGPDVRPSLYGATRTHPTVTVDDVRDSYELPLARLALAAGIPMLSICRGLQVLNVAAGGTLIQDIPSARPSDVVHTLTTPKSAIAHRVHVTPDSRLSALMSAQLSADHELAVNSRHHQAIETLAAGFAVTATAPDGIIEGIEHTEHPWCVAVQWHPENFWRSGEAAALFAGFVQASKTATHST